MQKIKYIIIFILTLALGMIYIQLDDYQQITSSLLDTNSKNKIEKKELQNKITYLTKRNEELQNQIISIEEKLSLTQIQLNNKILLENNNSNTIQIMDLPPYKIEENTTTTPYYPIPSITIDKENEITGFEVEYKQKF